MSRRDELNFVQPQSPSDFASSQTLLCQNFAKRLLRELVQERIGGLYSRENIKSIEAHDLAREQYSSPNQRPEIHALASEKRTVAPTLFRRIENTNLYNEALPGTPTYSQFIHVPNLVEPVPVVDLKHSKGTVTSQADQQFAGLPSDQGNCHLYTGTVVCGHIPEISLRCDPLSKSLDHWWKGAHLGMLFSRQFLTKRGYRQVDLSQAKAGDVLLVVDNSETGQERITHSAVMLGRRPDAMPIVRQKFDENHPVVDLTGEQFAKVYLSNGAHLEAWSK